MRQKPAALMIAAALVLAIVAVVLLSMSIDSLILRPGIVRSGANSESGSTFRSPSANTGELVRVLRIVWAVLVTVIVLCLLFWPTFRHMILKYMLAQLTYFAILFMLGALIFATIRSDQEQGGGPTPSIVGPQSANAIHAGSATGVAQDGFDIDQPLAASEIPLWQVGLIASSIVLALTALVIGGIYAGRRMGSGRRDLRIDPSPLHDLSTEAEKAVGRLQAGEDPGTVILECYKRMIDIVARRSGIESRLSLTPREFAHLLSQQQMETGHVARLTSIFEQARYGARRPAPYVEEALACLVAVRDAYAMAAQ